VAVESLQPSRVADATHHNFPMTLSRCLFYLGLFGTSFLSIRAGSVTTGDILLLMSAAALVVLAAARKIGSDGGLSPAWTAGTLLVLLGGTIAAVHALDFGTHMLMVGRFAFLLIGLPWMAQVLADTPRRLLVAATWWAAGAGVSGAGAIVQAAIGSNIPGLEAGVRNAAIGRYTGFTDNVSDLGAVACGGLVLAVALFVRGRLPWLMLPILGGCAAGMILSGSVSSLLAVIVGGFIIVLRGRPKLAPSLVLVAAGVAMLAVVLQVQSDNPNALTIRQRIEQVTGRHNYVPSESAAVQNTLATRAEVNRLGLDRGLDSPVGVGLDPASGGIALDVGVTLEPHDIFINALYRGGWLMALGLLLVLGSAVRQGWSLARGSVGSAVYAAMMAELAFALTSPSMIARYVWIPVVLVLAAVNLQKSSPAEAHQAGSPVIELARWR